MNSLIYPPDEIFSQLIPNQNSSEEVMTKKMEDLFENQNTQYKLNLILRSQVLMGKRKPSLAIYDHAFHFIGGAQKYGLTLIEGLLENFEITILANKDVSIDDFYKWYNLDLSKCMVKILPLPYFEKNKRHIDPAMVNEAQDNPFDIVSIESGNYDFFINNSMNEKVMPLSNISLTPS